LHGDPAGLEMVNYRDAPDASRPATLDYVPGLPAFRAAAASRMQRRVTEARPGPGCADPHPGSGPYAEVDAPTAVREKAAAMTEARGSPAALPCMSHLQQRRQHAFHRGPPAVGAPRADLLIVDHDSPEGTGRITDELAAADKRIRTGHAATGIRSGGP
jgi:hypothetical protein